MRLKHTIVVPNDIKLISDIFRTNGFELYLVGGCVRDSLLGVQPKDFDLVTNILPDDVINLLKKESFVTNILETGKSFGVINVITDTGEYEIATMREDIGSSDGRRPDSVKFTNIETDVLRRDLTCNALFYDLETQEIVDLVGGIDDIKNKIVRAVGDPVERFKEDKLRKLRCIRFAARFDSNLSIETHNALKEDSNLIGISGERIRDEFIKGVKSAVSVPDFIFLLIKYNLIGKLFDDLVILTAKQNSIQIGDTDYMVTISQLLSYNGADVISKKLNQLKYTVDEIKIIKFLISLKTLDIDTAVNLKKMQNNSIVVEEQIRKFCAFIDKPKQLVDAFINFKLTVSGNDIMLSTGLKAGPELGKKINEIEDKNFSDFFNTYNKII